MESKIESLIIIRYGELFLKGRNRITFIRILIENITLSLKKSNITNFSLTKKSDHLELKIEKKEEEEKTMALLKKIFGISKFYLINSLKSDLESLYEFLENISDFYDLKEVSTFRLKVSRNNKDFSKNSMTLQRELGKFIQDKYKLKVDLENPQKVFYINIYKDSILFFDKKIEGAKGLPVGSSGRTLVLMSGGIDSPVCSYELMKRGMEIEYIHFYHQENGQEKIMEIIEKISPYNNFSKKIHLINFSSVMREISHISDERYRIIILKRMFMRFACLVTEKSNKKISAIATGDSLGQVASQTIESISVINDASSLFIFYPLITLDKQEIIEKAKNIGTYDLSISKYDDCCSLFEPKNPITKPEKAKANNLEEKELIYWKNILENTFKNEKKTIN